MRNVETGNYYSFQIIFIKFLMRVFERPSLVNKYLFLNGYSGLQQRTGFTS